MQQQLTIVNSLFVGAEREENLITIDKFMVVHRGLAQSAALHSNDYASTNEKRKKVSGGINIANGWSCTKLRVRIHAGESKRRSRGTTTGRGKASQAWRQGWRWELVIIYHATDIVCSFHCQIIDCYDLRMIVRYNRFSPSCSWSVEQL